MIGAHLSETVLWTLAGTFAFLATASVVVFAHAATPPHGDHSEILQRTRTWWAIAAVFAASLVISRMASLGLLGLISFLALKEYLSIIPTRRVDRPVLLWAYLSVPIQYIWIAIEWYEMALVFIPACVFVALPIRMMLSGETQGFVRAVGTLHWGLMATVFCLSHMALLLVPPTPQYLVGGGAGLLLFLVLLTQLSDVAQYCCGKLFGRHKVAPRISPNKTWEGFVGGFAVTAVLSPLFAPWLTPFDVKEAMAAGILIAITGFVGDLAISALKRDLGIKDSGHLLPGHGGVLDRIDSLIFSAPLFFHFTRILHF